MLRHAGAGSDKFIPTIAEGSATLHNGVKLPPVPSSDNHRALLQQLFDAMHNVKKLGDASVKLHKELAGSNLVADRDTRALPEGDVEAHKTDAESLRDLAQSIVSEVDAILATNAARAAEVEAFNKEQADAAAADAAAAGDAAGAGAGAAASTSKLKLIRETAAAFLEEYSPGTSPATALGDYVSYEEWIAAKTASDAPAAGAGAGGSVGVAPRDMDAEASAVGGGFPKYGLWRLMRRGGITAVDPATLPVVEAAATVVARDFVSAAVEAACSTALPGSAKVGLQWAVALFLLVNVVLTLCVLVQVRRVGLKHVMDAMDRIGSVGCRSITGFYGCVRLRSLTPGAGDCVFLTRLVALLWSQPRAVPHPLCQAKR